MIIVELENRGSSSLRGTLDSVHKSSTSTDYSALLLLHTHRYGAVRVAEGKSLTPHRPVATVCGRTPADVSSLILDVSMLNKLASSQ